MEAEEKQELISDMLDTAYFAVMTLREFSGAEFARCALVLQIYPMQSVKEKAAPRLWATIYNSTSSCFSDSGSKFAL